MISELVPFLSDSKAEVRKIAVSHIASLNLAELNPCNEEMSALIQSLVKLVGDMSIIAKDALICLINLCEDADFIAQMLRCNLVGRVMENLKSSENTNEFLNLNCMLLSNITQNVPGAESMMQLNVHDGKLKGLFVMRLVEKFITVENGKNGHDPWQYCALILQNVSQIAEGRNLFCDSKKNIFPRLLPELQSKNFIRKRGISGLIKNVSLDLNWQPFCLYSKELNLIPNVLFSLNGPEVLKESDLVGMDPLVTSLGKNKVREGDIEVIRSLIESLLGLCINYKGRTELRRQKVYPIIRACHLAIEDFADEDTLEKLFSLVDFLMGSEKDGLADLHKPEGGKNEDYLPSMVPSSEKGQFVTVEESGVCEKVVEIDEDIEDMPELI